MASHSSIGDYPFRPTRTPPRAPAAVASLLVSRVHWPYHLPITPPGKRGRGRTHSRAGGGGGGRNLRV